MFSIVFIEISAKITSEKRIGGVNMRLENRLWEVMLCELCTVQHKNLFTVIYLHILINVKFCHGNLNATIFRHSTYQSNISEQVKTGGPLAVRIMSSPDIGQSWQNDLK